MEKGKQPPGVQGAICLIDNFFVEKLEFGLADSASGRELILIVVVEELPMPLLSNLKRSKTQENFDILPESTDRMPARPYRVLYADIPFCSDPECTSREEDANLVVLVSEDPKQQHQVKECMPTRKRYQVGQLVRWDLNNKKIWQSCWYKNPETGTTDMAWVQAVEFIGKVILVPQESPDHSPL
jgi:hypothetical protein